MFRNIQIRAVLNGYIVECGCQTLVFESGTAVLDHLTRYMENPTAYEGNFLVTLSDAKRVRLINPDYLAGPANENGTAPQCDAPMPLRTMAQERQYDAQVNMRSRGGDPSSCGAASEAPTGPTAGRNRR